MFSSVADVVRSVRRYPELTGARVLVTGVEPAFGPTLAKGFGAHGSRMIVQSGAIGPEAEAALASLDETCAELSLHREAIEGADSAVRFAQSAVKTYGGLDAAINLIQLSTEGLGDDVGYDVLEARVSHALTAACLVTRVVANRMRVTWADGLVLNVLVPPADDSAAGAALAMLARGALAAMTRGEAERFAEEGVRINAVAPAGDPLAQASGGSVLSSERDLTQLALHLASARGKALSGLVFDASGLTQRPC